MNPPDNSAVAPLKLLDGKPTFDEAWQAQVMAIVDALIAAEQLSASEWSEAFGAALKDAESQGADDTIETYYSAALQALEQLLDKREKVPLGEARARQNEWEQAYLRTPHGQPVTLTGG